MICESCETTYQRTDEPDGRVFLWFDWHGEQIGTYFDGQPYGCPNCGAQVDA